MAEHPQRSSLRLAASASPLPRDLSSDRIQGGAQHCSCHRPRAVPPGCPTGLGQAAHPPPQPPTSLSHTLTHKTYLQLIPTFSLITLTHRHTVTSTQLTPTHTQLTSGVHLTTLTPTQFSHPHTHTHTPTHNSYPEFISQPLHPHNSLSHTHTPHNSHIHTTLTPT